MDITETNAPYGVILADPPWWYPARSVDKRTRVILRLWTAYPLEGAAMAETADADRVNAFVVALLIGAVEVSSWYIINVLDYGGLSECKRGSWQDKLLA